MYHPHIYKTKLCQNVSKAGGCPKKNYCSFAHGRHEQRQPKFGSATGGVAQLPGLQTPFNSSLFTQPDFQTNSPSQSINSVNALPPQANHVAEGKQEAGVAASPVGDNDFRDATDQLKIRILDIVDQISGMHFERALMEQEKLRSGSDSGRLSGMLQDATQTIQRQQQDTFALSTRFDQISKYAQDLYEQASLYQSTITELKNQLDIQKGLKLSQLSSASLTKLEEEQSRILQRIQAQKKQMKSQEGKVTGSCSVCFRSKVDSALQPCGHQTTCQSCRLETCPVCGASVKNSLPVIDIERISTPPIPEFQLQPPPVLAATGTSTPVAAAGD